MNEDFEPDIELEPPCRILDRMHHIGNNVVKFEELKGTIATNQIGRFPITSQRGNSYIMVLYDFDSNVIDATALKSRTKEDLIEVYEELYQHVQEGGIQPVLPKLQNEASAQMIEAMTEKKDKIPISTTRRPPN